MAAKASIAKSDNIKVVQTMWRLETKGFSFGKQPEFGSSSCGKPAKLLFLFVMPPII